MYHLAQINIATMKARLEDPIMEGFSSRLDEINALAEKSSGFVWRLQTEEGNATAIMVNDEPLLLVNMSVWESIEALSEFTYRSNHVELIRGRTEWFEPPRSASFALWWTDQGHTPTVGEGLGKLAELDRESPSQRVFTFAKPFPAPDSEGT